MKNKLVRGSILGGSLLLPALAMAGTDATAITTAADTAFQAIATLCVAIGTFFVVYRLVKKVR